MRNFLFFLALMLVHCGSEFPAPTGEENDMYGHRNPYMNMPNMPAPSQGANPEIGLRDSRPLAKMPQNNRGASVLMNPGDTATLVENKWGGDDAEILSVNFGIEVVNAVVVNGTTNADSFVQAQIQWGIGGTTQSAIVDVVNGTTIRVPASTVRVTATYSSILPNTSPPLRVSGMLAYGVQANRTALARFTSRIHVANGASSAVFNIPAYASSFAVDSPQNGATCDIPLEDLGGTNTRALYTGFNCNLPDVGNALIPNGARCFQVKNTSGFDADYNVIWNLSL